VLTTGPTVVAGTTVVTGPTVVVESTAVTGATVVVESATVTESTVIVESTVTGSTKVIVAASPVPVIAPARIPEVTRAPLRKRAGPGLGVCCGAKTDQSQTDRDGGCCCGDTCGSIHPAGVPIACSSETP
jgi:hypothetical protein